MFGTQIAKVFGRVPPHMCASMSRPGDARAWVAAGMCVYLACVLVRARLNLLEEAGGSTWTLLYLTEIQRITLSCNAATRETDRQTCLWLALARPSTTTRFSSKRISRCGETIVNKQKINRWDRHQVERVLNIGKYYIVQPNTLGNYAGCH